MSEVFDPEKVKRIEFCGICLNCEIEPRVSASDYDKLLALYRWQENRVRDLAVMFKVPDGGRYMADWITKAEKLTS